MEDIQEALSDTALDLLFLQTSEKRQLLDRNIFLNFTSKIIPNKKMIKIALNNRPSGSSICVFVKDIFKSDYDRSALVWKEKWELQAKLAGLKKLPQVTMIPVWELKCAYQTFEAKRKLASTFDIFLADKRIMHHLPTKLGKAFYGYNTSKVPIGVSITVHNMLDNILKAVKSSQIIIHGKGASEAVLIGNTGMTKSQLRENMLSVVQAAYESWPGGEENIRSIRMQSVGGVAVPIYNDLTDSVPMEYLKSSALTKMKACAIIKTKQDSLPIAGKKKSIKPTPNIEISKLSRVINQNLVQITGKKVKASPINAKLTSLMQEVAKDLPLSNEKVAEVLGPKAKRANFKHKQVIRGKKIKQR